MTQRHQIIHRNAQYAGASLAGLCAMLCVMEWQYAGVRDFAGKRRVQGPDFRLS